jgi:hypothetical protein
MIVFNVRFAADWWQPRSAICRRARPAAYRQTNNFAAILTAPTLRFTHGRSA